MKNPLLITLLFLFYVKFGLAQDMLIIYGSAENLHLKDTNTEELDKENLSLLFYPEKGKIKLKEKKKTTKLKVKVTGKLKESNSGKTHILEFSNSGELVSSPPQLINNEDQIIFKVRAPDESDVEDRVINLGDRYYETITKLEKYKDVFETFYGIGNKEIETQQGHYLYQLEDLINKNISPEDHSYLKYLINKIKINKDFKDIKPKDPSDELPDLNSLCKLHYSVTYRLFKDGKLLYDSTLDLNSNDYKTDTISLNESDLLEFELRKLNPMEKMVSDWYSKNIDNKIFNKDFLQNLSDVLVETSKEINSKPFKVKLEKLEKIFQNRQCYSQAECKKGLDLIICLSKQPSILLDLLKSETAKTWIKSWLWLTKGVPKINPFAHQAQSIFPSNLAAEKRELAIYEELLAKNSIELNESKEVMDLVKKMAQIKEKIAGESPKPPFLRDDLLYRGELGVSTSDAIYMRHHNVKNNFLPMNREPISSIKENERLLVLVHNKNPGANYTIEPEIKLITNDATRIEEDFKALGNIADINFGDAIKEIIKYKQGFIPDSMAVDSCVVFNDAYPLFDTLFNNNLKFIKSLQLGPSLPLKLPSDKTAKLESKIIYFEPPSLDSIPYIVKYDIKEGDKVLHKGSYRATKLYRFRAKVGPMYSFLNRNNYTIDDNDISLSKNPHQFDVTAGVQYYIERFDIREQKPSWKVKPQPWHYGSFIYLGMGLKNNPIENWVLGLGYEPYPGASIIVGGHFGQNERLHLNENGKPNIQNPIKGAAFISVGFDLSVFSSFFGISGIFK
ncbi:hypothetical protein GCM10027284_46320 [Cyclobacterium sediminis]